MTAELPTTDVVWAAVSWMLRELELDPGVGGAGVGVFPGWAGDTAPPELVWLSGIDSDDLAYPVMTGGRIPVDETYTAKLEVGVFGATTLEGAQDRLATIIGAIDSRLRDAPNLDGHPGILSALVTSKRRSVGQTPDGIVGYGELVVTIETRLY